MSHPQEAHVASYQQQELHLATLGRMTRLEFLEYEKTVDAWRHQRMMKPFQLFASESGWRWLTIGDAHGWDAARLGSMGAPDVTASDLSGIMLEHAKNEGLIQNYRVENAESMTTSTEEFDVVFCKEAFHHLPRPWIGLYEMLRVARKVVLLIEPRDWIIDKGPVMLSGPRGLVKNLLAWTRMRLRRAPERVSSAAMFRLGDKPHYEEAGWHIKSLTRNPYLRRNPEEVCTE